MRHVAFILSLVLFSCSTTPSPAPTPSASPSPTAPATVYPASGWHTDYTAWLKEGFAQHDPASLESMCKVPMTPDTWVIYWKTIISAESSFNRASQFVEPPNKKTGKCTIDHVTGKCLVSEGLFQLSYADEGGYPACDFDYASDKSKGAKDLTKSIFDARKQFKCAMAISTKLFKNYPKGHPSWVNPLGAYWSTARSSSNARAKLKAALPQCF